MIKIDMTKSISTLENEIKVLIEQYNALKVDRLEYIKNNGGCNIMNPIVNAYKKDNAHKIMKIRLDIKIARANILAIREGDCEIIISEEDDTVILGIMKSDKVLSFDIVGIYNGLIVDDTSFDDWDFVKNDCIANGATVEVIKNAL
ncbi:MAG: hypothetical protein ACRCXX_11685 [Cetobacterium sp.]|uniref:hypothetical protein n=1 Tax=Cetobacterium sp. TaxID=2071632 RepID=UPI003F3A4524